MEALVIDLVIRMKMNSDKRACGLERWHRKRGAEFSKNRIVIQRTIPNLKQKSESLSSNDQILINQNILYINFTRCFAEKQWLWEGFPSHTSRYVYVTQGWGSVAGSLLLPSSLMLYLSEFRIRGWMYTLNVPHNVTDLNVFFPRFSHQMCVLQL